MITIYEIVPGRLYQSARTHTLTDAELDQLVEDYGITAVLNLWHSDDPRMAARVLVYEVHSLPDGKLLAALADTAEQLADKVANLIKRKHHRVLVHCWGGKNRSGLITALTLMRLEKGLTGSDAIDRVKAVRKGALANEHFCAYLRSKDIA